MDKLMEQQAVSEVTKIQRSVRLPGIQYRKVWGNTR
jgi:hypothetical protein